MHGFYAFLGLLYSTGPQLESQLPSAHMALEGQTPALEKWPDYRSFHG